MSSRSEIVEQIPHLRRYAIALLRDRDAADDLVQDCLERALSRWSLFRHGTNLRRWLFTIMHNLHVNAANRRRVAPVSLAGDSDPPDARVPANQEARIEVASLAQAIDLLPDEQRQVVLLIGLEAMTYQEAAAIVGVPVGTVMSRLHRGRERLRALTSGGCGPRLTTVK